MRRLGPSAAASGPMGSQSRLARRSRLVAGPHPVDLDRGGEKLNVYQRTVLAHPPGDALSSPRPCPRLMAPARGADPGISRRPPLLSMSTPRSSESVVGVDHQTIQQDVARGQDAVISTLGTGLNANQKLIEGSTEPCSRQCA